MESGDLDAGSEGEESAEPAGAEAEVGCRRVVALLLCTTASY